MPTNQLNFFWKMAIKISDLKPKESLVTELGENDTKKICGGGGVESGGTGPTGARIRQISIFSGGVGADGTGPSS
jgi:hypothetical protein